MKTVSLLIFLLFASHFCIGQNRQINSFRHQLFIAPNDTAKVLILAKLVFWLRYTSPDSARLLGQQALLLAQQIKFLRGEVNMLNVYGILMRELGDLPKSLTFQLKALKIAESENYRIETAKCLNSIGVIYHDLKDYPKSIQYLNRSKRISEAVHDEPYLAQTQGNLANDYEEMNQLDSSLYYLQQALQLATHLKESEAIFTSQSILRYFGNIYSRKGNYPLALSYYQQSIQGSIQNEDHRNSSLAHSQIANIYQQKNQLDSCIFYARIGLSEAQGISHRIGILTASSLLTQACKAKGDFKQAFGYQEIMIATKDELYGANKVQALQKIVFEEQEHQRKIETERIAYQNQLKQYAFLVGLGVLFLIAFILYRNNRQKKKVNLLLKQQKEKAESALSQLKTTQTQLIQREKMASLGELTAGIAHEIQNPLNFVNNFSELSVELMDELEVEAHKGNTNEVSLLARDIKENLTKITQHGQRASNIVKGMLEHSRTSSGQKEPTNLNALADEYLRLAYQGWRAKDKSFNCELVTDFDPDLLQANVVPQEMGRVFLNLYSNAFYALQQKQAIDPSAFKPTVTVSTRLIPQRPERAKSIAHPNGVGANGIGPNGVGRLIEIRVKDNGTGIPDSIKAKIFQPFFTTKPTGEGTGLGLSLSYDIVTKGHGGTLDVTTEPGEFTEFIVVLPIA